MDQRTLKAQKEEGDELEVKDAVQLASVHAKNIMDSKEYSTQKFVSQYLAALKSKMLTEVADVNKWKRVIISQHDAKEQAMVEYMTKAERELWQRYFESKTERINPLLQKRRADSRQKISRLCSQEKEFQSRDWSGFRAPLLFSNSII